MKINVRKSMYGFSTSFVAKRENEEDEFGYVDVGFRKDQEPQIQEGEVVRLFIKDGFLSGYKSKAGLKPKIVVMEYDIVEKKESNKEQVSKAQLEPIDGENLPFWLGA